MMKKVIEIEKFKVLRGGFLIAFVTKLSQILPTCICKAK